MHHIVHCIDRVSSLFASVVPLGRRYTNVVIVDTDEDSMLSSEVPGKQKPLLFIPIQSHFLAPTLFYCIRTTTIHLLLAAVAEPPLSFA